MDETKMTADFYDYWLRMPRWRKAWCWLAYHLWMVLPVSLAEKDDGLYQRFSLWLLSYGGAYAYRDVIHPATHEG